MPQFPNPRSGFDVERIRPIIEMVDRAAGDRGRPQLIRVTAWHGDRELGRTLCTNDSVNLAITGYPEATHLTVEAVGNA
jgi:hypothetical protein